MTLSSPRPVHEIMQHRRTLPDGKQTFVLLAFIQHGTADDGYSYETVCPLCGTTVGHVEEQPDAAGVPAELTMAQLRDAMRAQMLTHRTKGGACAPPFAGGSQLAVVKTQRPLDTQTKRRIL